MDLEPLSCPSCGAPLSVPVGATAAICHYCNGALRVHASNASTGLATTPGPTVVAADPSITPGAIARIKQLLLLGKREEAVALYQAESHGDRPTAETTIDAYAADAAGSTLEAGRLNAAGMGMSACAVLLLAGSVVLRAVGIVSWAVAGGMALPSLLWVLLTGRRALRTVRYLSATPGTATVVRFALIGKDPQQDTLFRLLLDVRDSAGSTFRAEIPLVLGPAHAAAMKEGHRLRVKFFPGVPNSVLYDGELADGAAAGRS